MVISRLVYRKGVDLLVGIIPKVCQKLPHVDFIIGGDGNKLLNLQEMVERERIQDRVEFLGSVQHADVRDVLTRGSIFLNCSLTESFCIAILEAASCGLLVVSTDVGGVPEVLPEDMIELAKPRVDPLVESVFRAVARQQGRNALDPHEAHQRVKKMYSWDRVARQTELAYDQIKEHDKLDFVERMECYLSLGGFSGLIACLLAVLIECWMQIVYWLQPTDKIEVIDDLNLQVPTARRNEKDKGL